jgi:hypothetical protein
MTDLMQVEWIVKASQAIGSMKEVGTYLDVIISKANEAEIALQRVLQRPTPKADGQRLGLENLVKVEDKNLGLNKMEDAMTTLKKKMPHVDIRKLNQGFLSSDMLSARLAANYGKAGQELANLNMLGINTDSTFAKLNARFGAQSEKMKFLTAAYNKQLKANANMISLQKQMKMMGPMFGFMFGGMMLKQLGNSMARFLFPAMDKLEGYNSRGVKQVNALNASWQFLKFSMFEAISQSKIFQIMIEAAINLTNWVSQVASHWGTALAAVLGFSLALVGIGQIGWIAGGFLQIGMLWEALFGSGVKTVAGSTAAINKVKSGIEGLGKAINLALAITGAIMSFKLVWEGVKETDILKMVGGGIAGALFVAAGITGYFNPVLGLVLSVAGIITLGITKFFVKIRDEAGAKKAILNQAEEIGQGITVDTGYWANLGKGPTTDMFGVPNGNNEKEALDAGALNYVSQYADSLKSIKVLQDAIDNPINADQYDANVQSLAAVQAKIAEIEYIASLYDETVGDTGKTLAELLATQKNVADFEDKKKEQVDAQNDALDMQVGKYTPIVTSIAASKERTAEFTANLQALTAIINGNEFSMAILALHTMDMTFVDANTHLTTFAKALSDWAAQPVTKTIWIEYKEKNKPNSDAGSALSSISSSVKTFFGSVTGKAT